MSESHMLRGGSKGSQRSLGQVNLVRGWDWDSTGNNNFIRLGNMLGNNNITSNSTWDSNRDINIVFLDIDLWDNVGCL